MFRVRSRYAAGMVGDPKRLSDLAKIDADVRIVCRRCRFEEDWTREALARHLAAIGGSQVWSEITRHLRCRRVGCGSADLRHVAVPYPRRQPNLPRRVGALDERLIGAALDILGEAATRARLAPVNTIEVRLALLVLHRYARDGAAARLLWERAGRTESAIHEGLDQPLAVLRYRLQAAGWIAPTVLIERTKTWPWNSPAPPGWLSPPGHGREGEN